MQWRYIPFQHYDPYVKTGLNRASLESVQDGGSPLFWLAGWRQGCINVGYTQTIAEQVDIDEAERQGIPIVRRQGAGGTTYLSEDGEITWGIAAPAHLFPDDLNAVYQSVCGTVADAVGRLGIEAHHEPVNDVVTENGKISGATAKKNRDVIYIGGTLLYSVDTETMFSLLTPDDDKIQDKEIEAYRDRVTSVSQESDASFEETIQALQQALLSDRDFREDGWSEEEMERAKKLAEKYSSEDWLYRDE
jgi:lipoate-protein ligase A